MLLGELFLQHPFSSLAWTRRIRAWGKRVALVENLSVGANGMLVTPGLRTGRANGKLITNFSHCCYLPMKGLEDSCEEHAAYIINPVGTQTHRTGF